MNIDSQTRTFQYLKIICSKGITYTLTLSGENSSSLTKVSNGKTEIIPICYGLKGYKSFPDIDFGVVS